MVRAFLFSLSICLGYLSLDWVLLGDVPNKDKIRESTVGKNGIDGLVTWLDFLDLVMLQPCHFILLPVSQDHHELIVRGLGSLWCDQCLAHVRATISACVKLPHPLSRMTHHDSDLTYSLRMRAYERMSWQLYFLNDIYEFRSRLIIKDLQMHEDHI